MPYNTVNPTLVTDAIVEWLKAERTKIDNASLLSGGWERWAAVEFPLWMRQQFQDGEELDVVSEVNIIPGTDVSVYKERTLLTDLVFNALSRPGETAPPVIVMELKCQSPRQRWTDFRAGLVEDYSRLYNINPLLREHFDDRGVIGMSVGICFNDPDLVPADGYQVKKAGNLAVQWWSDTTI